MVIKGACLSRIESRVESKLLSSSCNDVGGCSIKSDEARSLLNSMKLMFLVRRKEIQKGMRGGGCGCNVELSENRKVIRYSDKRL